MPHQHAVRHEQRLQVGPAVRYGDGGEAQQERRSRKGRGGAHHGSSTTMAVQGHATDRAT